MLCLCVVYARVHTCNICNRMHTILKVNVCYSFTSHMIWQCHAIPYLITPCPVMMFMYTEREEERDRGREEGREGGREGGSEGERERERERVRERERERVTHASVNTLVSARSGGLREVCRLLRGFGRRGAPPG